MTSFRIPDQVMARQVGEETVILDLASGMYFGLDEVGSRVWMLIAEGKSAAGICEALAAEYEVSREILQADVETLLGQLRSRGLIESAA